VLVYAVQTALLWRAAEAVTVTHETCKLHCISNESKEKIVDVPVHLQAM
jgi:hypothetical protein